MNDKRNFFAGLTSSVWAAIAGLIAMPFYLTYLGAAAFGMIGVHLALQGLFMLLDMGFSPAVSREIARASAAGAIERGRAVLHSMSAIFTLVGAVAALALVAASPWIAQHWIISDALETSEIQTSLALSAIALGVRWPGAIYVGALNGAHRADIASAITTISNTMATLGAILVLALVEPTLKAFFVWQGLVGAGHTLCMRWAAWQTIGPRNERGYNWQSALAGWRFTAGVAGVGITGALMMNLDRIILSKTTDLESVGRYTIALSFAGLLYRITVPAFNVLFPKLTFMFEEGHSDPIRVYYQRFSGVIFAIVCPAAAFLCAAAEPLLELWFSDPNIVQGVWLPAVVLCLATMIHCIMYLPFALQLASGNSQLPLYINFGLLAIFAPLLYWLSIELGLLGAALAWLATHVVYLFVGTYLTGRIIFPKTGTRWIWRGLTLPAAVSFFAYVLASLVSSQVESPWLKLAVALISTGLAVILGFMLMADKRDNFWAVSTMLRQRLK